MRVSMTMMERGDRLEVEETDTGTSNIRVTFIDTHYGEVNVWLTPERAQELSDRLRVVLG